jgi:hypothetical protein
MIGQGGVAICKDRGLAKCEDRAPSRVLLEPFTGGFRATPEVAFTDGTKPRVVVANRSLTWK